jgi:hypothetical protein
MPVSSLKFFFFAGSYITQLHARLVIHCYSAGTSPYLKFRQCEIWLEMESMMSIYAVEVGSLVRELSVLDL